SSSRQTYQADVRSRQYRHLCGIRPVRRPVERDRYLHQVAIECHAAGGRVEAGEGQVGGPGRGAEGAVAAGRVEQRGVEVHVALARLVAPGQLRLGQQPARGPGDEVVGERVGDAPYFPPVGVNRGRAHHDITVQVRVEGDAAAHDAE